MNIYLKSGLIDNVSPKFGDIKCDWKNKLLSLWKELLIFGDGSLRWLNGPDTLNIFEWLFGLKLFSVLPGIFTGADDPCKRPIFVEAFSCIDADVSVFCFPYWNKHLPEIEFDSWDPGILSGVVELCIKLDRSSKLFAIDTIPKIH